MIPDKPSANSAILRGTYCANGLGCCGFVRADLWPIFITHIMKDHLTDIEATK